MQYKEAMKFEYFSIQDNIVKTSVGVNNDYPDGANLVEVAEDFGKFMSAAFGRQIRCVLRTVTAEDDWK